MFWKKKKQLFHVRGHPRSGTNWLGDILNLHPHVFTTGEFSLHLLEDSLNTLLQQNWYLFSRQNYELYMKELFRDFLEKAFLYSEQLCEKPLIKRIGERTPTLLFKSIIEGNKIIYIYRDGRDVLVSWTFHVLSKPRVLDLTAYPLLQENVETFKHDKYYFHKHPEKLLQDEKWVFDVATMWMNHVRQDLNHMGVRSLRGNEIVRNIMVVKYENLHTDFDHIKSSLFNFLGVNPKLARQASEGSAPGISTEDSHSGRRKGKIGDWKNYFTPTSEKIFMEIAGELLSDLGYS